MTGDDFADRAWCLAVERDEPNGHTLDELSAYLDAGRTPPDPSIEGSEACRQALDAMERLRILAQAMLEQDAASAADASWVDRILDAIASDASTGRSASVADRT
ncbi:MAG TPA: hypothetical protein VGC18_07890 [Lacisediminihabitans sp.]|uniref:hypothetical protein n=1 Tax=Lacisediminihabitans sp. TaxID=2787631 RepID=UPI002ED9B351